MLFWILAGLGVYMVNVFLPAILYMPQEGTMTHMGSRDELPEPDAKVGRARRALANMQENLPIFITLGLLAMIVADVNMPQAILGAQLFVFGRLAYIAMYMISIPFTRSAAYTVGLVGCVLMLLALI